MIRSRLGPHTKVVLVAALLLALLGSLVFAERSEAGRYYVRNCFNESPPHFAAAYEQLGGGRVNVDGECVVNETQAGIYQDRSGNWLNQGAGGLFRWAAPAGSAFTASKFFAALKNANGIIAQLIAANSDGSGAIDLDGATAHDGQPRQLNVYFRDSPTTQIVARLSCQVSPPCSNQPSDPKAFLQLESIELEMWDSAAPAAGASGPLLANDPENRWHRGSEEVILSATDQGAGIWKFVRVVNGSVATIGTAPCPGDRGAFADRMQPCPAASSLTTPVSTAGAPFIDGPNQVQFCAKDYFNGDPDQPGAGNTGCTQTYVLKVDNTAPNSPLNLVTVGGSGWRPVNSFEVAWSNPPGQVSPITGAHYKVERTDGAPVQGDTFVAGSGIDGFGGITVPEPGEYRVQVWLEDAAGNVGQAASTLIRFDDLHPGDAAPGPAAGWLSRDELPYPQLLDRAVAGGPSGVAGYAVSIDAAAGVSPCAGATCTAAEIDLQGGPDERTYSIASLPEGTRWVNSVAVSGATVPSAGVRTTALRVDKTEPVTTLAGVPGGWTDEAVTLTANAADELSGMTPAPGYDDGQPLTTVQVDDNSPLTAIGDGLTLAVAAEGVHTIRYWARDLAGNVNDGKIGPAGRHSDPGRATVMIDRSGPRAVFDAALDPADPELIGATVTDSLSGVASGVISFRRVGSQGAFRPLRARLAGERLTARFPSDTVADGAYEFRAIAVDKVGNRATGVLRSDGSAMVLRNPVKRLTKLTARFTGGDPTARGIRYGRPALVAGRLTHAAGTPLRNAEIVVTERFAPGSMRAVHRMSARTDRSGAFAVRLRPGPSRIIGVEFRGTGTLARATAGKPLRLAVGGDVRFNLSPRVLRNGSEVLMGGSVGRRGARVPQAGKLVELQFYDPGRRRWRSVELLGTDRGGRFRYRYRFRTITTAQRILFRAVSVKEAGWPYGPAASAPRSVLVYP